MKIGVFFRRALTTIYAYKFIILSACLIMFIPLSAAAGYYWFHCNPLGDFAEWASGFIACIGIVGLGYQLKMAKEREFSAQRQLFKISLECPNECKNDAKSKKYLPTNTKYKNEVKKHYKNMDIGNVCEWHVVELKNISEKPIIAARVVFSYVGTEKISEFKLDRIKKWHTVHFVDKNEKALDSVIVYYRTTLREKIRLVFDAEKNYLKYNIKGKRIENKNPWINRKDEYTNIDKGYTLDNFIESETL